MDDTQARAILAQQPPDAILCDQRMPGQTGVAFLKEVRERWPNTVRPAAESRHRQGVAGAGHSLGAKRHGALACPCT
jgi:CheY-like chemotaxis protein